VRPTDRQFTSRGALATIVAILVASCGMAGLAVSSQTPPASARPTFRSGVLLIEVDLTATDERGQPVTDLRQDEIEVLEDGLTRNIVSFARVEAPVAPRRQPHHADVATNDGVDRGRIIFLVLDDANTSTAATAGVRSAAIELLSRLSPEDRVGMLFVSLGSSGAFEFTSNHAGLMAALDTYAGEQSWASRRAGAEFGAARLSMSDAEGENPGAFGGVFDPGDLKGAFDRFRPFEIVADVSNYLAALPHRRKALVYIGEALSELPPETPDQGDWAERARMALARAVTAARRANVAVYLLDPRRPFRSGAQGLFEHERTRALRSMRADDLSTLADVTGGSSSLTRTITAQVERIVTDTGSYYLLGYEAEPPASKGLMRRLRKATNPWEGFREIEVRTTRPGVRVRARRGYWADGEADRSRSVVATSASRRDAAAVAVGGLVPRGDLSLASFAAPFRGAGGKPVVAFAIEVRSPSFATNTAAGFDDSIDVDVVAIEPGNKVRASNRFSAQMHLSADKAIALEGGRYLVCGTLPVDPRRYQLRIGVRSTAAGSAGSVYQDVVVPDFGRRPLALSGIAIGTSRSQAPMPAARAATIAPYLPWPPTLRREFAASDDASAFVRVYRRSARTSASLHVGAHSLDDESRAVWTSKEAVTFAGNEAALTYALPLSTWSPGRYRLSMVLVDATGAIVDERTLDLTVTP